MALVDAAKLAGGDRVEPVVKAAIVEPVTAPAIEVFDCFHVHSGSRD